MDATGPGPAGVPGPADSVEFASSAFSRAGFSQSEMIQAMYVGPWPEREWSKKFEIDRT